ncbi:MAG TPA: hypothetical protein VIU29_03605 [Candidatus Deferrimicrobiaceae bacterium]
MRRVECSNLVSGLVLLVFIGCPAVASAIPAISCHCFQDRSYDPAQPAAADPYLLASAQNSLFAAVFAIDKKTIVMKKQKGASGDDLWVAYWLAARSGGDPESLLDERKGKGSWHKVAAPKAIPESALGARVAAALKGDASDERLGQAVVDEVMLRFRFHGEPELAALRKAGAGNQEAILAGLLASRVHQPASQLYRDVKSGQSSWGGLLRQAGVEPSAIESATAMMVRAATATGR